MEGTTATLTVNGLEVRYEEPSNIADDRNIRVVFFKENLSTGWDCPRAETMMSFKHASDATYIAQLLGRMVRTPMQMHIQVDDVLNDVHLYLPYFNEDTVKDVVEALQSTEGGDIPTDIYGESLSGKRFETLTVKPKKKKEDQPTPGQMTLFDVFSGQTSDPQTTSTPTEASGTDSSAAPSQTTIEQTSPSEPTGQSYQPGIESTAPAQSTPVTPQTPIVTTPSGSNSEVSVQESQSEEAEEEDLFDREAVMKFINDAGLLSYNVRALRINDYLKSLYRMAHLLTMSKLHREAIREVQDEIVEMIHNYVESLRAAGKYDDLVQQVKQFKLATQISMPLARPWTIILYTTCSRRPIPISSGSSRLQTSSSVEKASVWLMETSTWISLT